MFVIDGFTTSELDEIERTYYAFNFYPDLMTVLEIEAYSHFLATAELAFDLNTSRRPVDKAGSDDPAALFLARRRARDIYIPHRKEDSEGPWRPSFVNCCSRCGELARTPEAQHCRYCGNEWREAAAMKSSDR